MAFTLVDIPFCTDCDLVDQTLPFANQTGARLEFRPTIWWSIFGIRFESGRQATQLAVESLGHAAVCLRLCPPC